MAVACKAIETLAAVLGGVQTIATSSYDEAFAIPTEDAATIALRTQQIVANEAGVTGTVDPLGGSYAIESLTYAIERDVFQYLEKIESLGGAVACIENGYYHRELGEAAYRYQRQIETKDRILFRRVHAEPGTMVAAHMNDGGRRHRRRGEEKPMPGSAAVLAAVPAVLQVCAGGRLSPPAVCRRGP